MSKAEQKARALIASRSTENLLRDFELTESINDPEIYTVRGWLMDELWKRNPDGCNQWLDDGYELIGKGQHWGDDSLKNYF